MTQSLKELTAEVHRAAERKPFAKLLLSGKITPEKYLEYLYNQYLNYSCLETRVANEYPELHDIIRCHLIKDDIDEIVSLYDLKMPYGSETNSTREYCEYVISLDKKDILAHVYVRHFGDLYGGQIIKRQIPGSGKMYEFKNPEDIKARVRSMLDESMAEEAKTCFRFATRLFEELIDNE